MDNRLTMGILQIIDLINASFFHSDRTWSYNSNNTSAKWIYSDQWIR